MSIAANPIYRSPYPGRHKHIWVNTPEGRAQIRQAELMRKIPRPKRFFRFKLGDRPHILPFSSHDLKATWRWITHRHDAPVFLMSTGKSHPIF